MAVFRVEKEEPLRMDQTMRQNVVDAISAFRRA